MSLEDARIRPAPRALSVLIDASALRWRIELSGGGAGSRARHGIIALTLTEAARRAQGGAYRAAA